ELIAGSRYLPKQCTHLVPPGSTQALLELPLCAVPMALRLLKLLSPLGCQPEKFPPPVLSHLNLNPPAPCQRFQHPRQTGGIQCQDFSEATLRDLPGNVQRHKQSELR